MSEIDVLRSQEYSTNLGLLAQQMGSKFGDACIMESVSGAKAKRIMSQVDSTEAVDIDTSASPAMNVDMVHDGRWVYHQKKGWGKVVDELDLIKTGIKPQGAYVMSAVAALKRKTDDLFTNAFFGTAKTGETGGTSTTFDANNVVAVTEGVGSATGLNLAKLEASLEILLDNNVDLDFETPYIGIGPKQHRNLKALTQVTSGDFTRKFVLDGDGMVKFFNGFNVIVSSRLPTDSNGYRRCPVWVRSGMAKGVWSDIRGVVRKRPDLQDNPDYVEAFMEIDFTRMEEAKCLEIKCSES